METTAATQGYLFELQQTNSLEFPWETTILTLKTLFKGLFMWRRESGETGSGPLGEIGIVAPHNISTEVKPGCQQQQSIQHQELSSLLPYNQHCHRNFLHTLQIHNIGPSIRCDSSFLGDSPIKKETIKLVRELNRAVASHIALAALLGGSADGPHLRDELRKARRTAQETAGAAKATLLPFLLDPRWMERERLELERLWCLLLCSLDFLECSMQRSLNLLREFSLADGSHSLIHTGLDTPNHHQVRLNQSSSVEVTDVSLLDKLALEGVEASQLCKELFELRSQLQELKSAVEIHSFTPPESEELVEVLRKKPLRIETLLSMNGRDVLGGNAGCSSISCSIPSGDKESIDDSDEDGSSSEDEGITSHQRRCICYILTVMMTVFGMAMLLGVIIAVFS